jgi:hypothetical protein
MTEGKRVSLTARRYEKVNALWPESALPSLTAQEAISATKRLYRLGTGKAFKGKFKIATGNRRTWIRNGVFVVNPSKGWHDLVHSISHLSHYKTHPGKSGHHYTHADFERRMIEAVVSKGWLDGGLKREAPVQPDKATLRYQRILTRITSWERKLKRAENALRKLRRSKTVYERKAGI